jgi:cytochrome c-type biogenesis protein CcmH
MTLLRSFWLWLVVFVAVLAIAVAVNPSAPSNATRIAHLESLVKCPACEDLSVAESNATSAIAVRREITEDVGVGMSDNKILTTIEAQYGPQILLSPSTSGLGVLLWVVPVAALAVLVAALLGLARRRRA